MKSLAPNTLLQNRYLVVQLIGKGGMGEVYLAVDQRLGSAVALKRMLFTQEEALGNAFEREAKMLARLRHPALTKVSDHFTENETQYLVMEHISGEDLAKRLEQNQKPFPLSWVLFWADQLLDALTYLHSHEPPIIHRDIKPQNLKLTNENHIILLDFGLAKNEGGETRLSTTGDVVAYTPHYASMEQIRGTGTTARSDIYSLCATIYQLLTNSTPPDALSRADSVLNNLPDSVQPLNELNSEVTVPIAKVIMKGMSLSAEQRFGSAKEMQIALREAYSQLQQGMSADTVAFNVADELQNVPTIPELKQSDIKTEIYSVPELSQPIVAKTESIPVVTESGVNENPVTNSNESPNAEATLPFVTPLVFNAAENTPPIGEKTEVMPVELNPAIGEKTEVMPFDLIPVVEQNTEVTPFDSTPDFGAKTVISPIEFPVTNEAKTEISPLATPPPFETKPEIIPIDVTDFAAMEVTEVVPDPMATIITPPDTFQSQESFNPQATVPLVNLGEQVPQMPPSDTGNYNTTPPKENQPKENVSQPVATKPEQNKKAAAGGGKTFIILGILALLGFLGIGGVGAGLYVFKPELFTSATPTPSPTPQPTPTAEPKLTPTPEPTLETNINSGNNSGELTNTNTNTNTNTGEDKPVGTEKTPRPQVEKTAQPIPEKTVQAPTRTPTAKTPPPIKTPPPAKQTPPPSKKIEQ